MAGLRASLLPPEIERTRQNGAAPPQVWDRDLITGGRLDNNLLNTQRFCLAFGMHILRGVSNSITLKGACYRGAAPNVPHLAFGCSSRPGAMSAAPEEGKETRYVPGNQEE
jgi:hypothetical protein